MKKAILTLAIVLGMGMFSFAGEENTNQGGGLFGYGNQIYDRESGNRDNPLLPPHDQSTNQDSNAPLGSGIVALIGFGAAYAFAKKSEKN